MHAHSNPAEQGPLGFESTKTRTAQPCNKKPRVIRPRATGTSAIIVTIEGKARAAVAARRVRSGGALPAGDVDGNAPRRPHRQVARLQREPALGVRARSGRACAARGVDAVAAIAYVVLSQSRVRVLSVFLQLLCSGSRAASILKIEEKTVPHQVLG